MAQNYPYPDNAVERVVDEVKSIAAYLAQMKDPAIDQGDCLILPQHPVRLLPGEEVVKSVGCLSCHAVDGLGSDFAPKLDTVGSKLTPQFLRQWISDPRSYDPDTAMPSLRLTKTEVDNTVSLPNVVCKRRQRLLLLAMIILTQRLIRWKAKS